MPLADAFLDAHEISVLAEGGLLATIPATLAILLLGYTIRRNLRVATWVRGGAAVGLLAMATQEVFEFSLQIPANALLFCTLAAVALTPVDGVSRRVMSRDSITTPERSTDEGITLLVDIDSSVSRVEKPPETIERLMQTLGLKQPSDA